MAVDMTLAVFSLEGETDSGGLGNAFKNLFQSFPNLSELGRARQCEIEVFGKAIVAKMTALECGPTLEGEDLAEPALAHANQKPSEAVIAFEHGLGNAASSVLLMQTVCEQREISLRDHVCGMASSSDLSMFSWRRHRASKRPDFGKLGSRRS